LPFCVLTREFCGYHTKYAQEDATDNVIGALPDLAA
jgi:hypothetical protein